MSSPQILVPDHVAMSEKAKKSIAAVYVDEKDKYLDPSRLSKSLKERLPQPTGWRMLVMPYKGKATSDGGIHIPDSVREREALATVVAYVLKLGPLSYKDAAKFGESCNPWCKEGQWICIGRYAGSRFNLEDGEVRIINDEDVIATIIDPDDIKHV
jgi:co-chaperonin GroES (HSP10)